MNEHSKTILIVEDDSLILEILRDVLLEEGGFEVLVASDATEALSVIDKSGGVDLVLADQNMPGSMDGPALLHHVHQQWPSIAMVLMSGGFRKMELPVGARFIQKPVMIADLLALMHELLDDAGR